MKEIRRSLLLSVSLALSVQQALAGKSIFNGAAVLEQMTRATQTADGANFAEFSSSSPSAVLDWSRFNVPDGTKMGFVGTGTTFFNLVSAAAGKSQIDGMIAGDGNVWVINPSGVAIGATSQVDVGGLFAVAAGNLANETALRDGSAFVPEFLSLGGRVDVDSGATFSADQVALLGKTVSAAGDFRNVGSLEIGGAGRLVVDEVGGGWISTCSGAAR